MSHVSPNRRPNRKATIAVLMALLLIPIFALAAFAVDYGYLLWVQTDLQRTADAAALAAVQDLIPAKDGTQDLNAARATAQSYAALNGDSGDPKNTLKVLDADIQIGRYDTSTIYSKVNLLSNGNFDTVRVTVRRDSTANSPVSLFFAPLIGLSDANITATATAVLQTGSYLSPGAKILPFAFHVDTWNTMNLGDTRVIYGDQKVKDALGNDVPGNWGTVDVGATNNSASEIRDQILSGLRQSDLDALHSDGRIPDSISIDASAPMWVQSDPGLSGDLKLAIEQIHGKTRLIPLYDTLVTPPGGNNPEWRIVGWGTVVVVDSKWTGAHNTSVTIEKSFLYEGNLTAKADLSDTTPLIEGAYTSPVLVD